MLAEGVGCGKVVKVTNSTPIRLKNGFSFRDSCERDPKGSATPFEIKQAGSEADKLPHRTKSRNVIRRSGRIAISLSHQKSDKLWGLERRKEGKKVKREGRLAILGKRGRKNQALSLA